MMDASTIILYNEISKNVKEMKKDQLILELIKYKFNFELPNGESIGEVLNFKQELIYNKVMREVIKLNKKTLITELIRLRLSYEIYQFNQIKEHINEDGSVKMEDFFINENYKYQLCI